MSAMRTVIASRPFLSCSRRLRRSTAIILSSTLIACAGCKDPNVADSSASNPGSPAASPSAESKADALAELLQQAKTGDIDIAIQRFVSDAPDNWIESTALEDLRMSEASFMELDRDEKKSLSTKVH
jgi:hypothetical protein